MASSAFGEESIREHYTSSKSIHNFRQTEDFVQVYIHWYDITQYEEIGGVEKVNLAQLWKFNILISKRRTSMARLRQYNQLL